MNQLAPTKDEIKLIIDNSNLEMEKRVTEKVQTSLKDFGDAITKNNQMYLDHIVRQETKLTIVENQIRILKTRLAVIGSAATALGGLVGFFISQFTNSK
jgi:hypothetical protein